MTQADKMSSDGQNTDGGKIDGGPKAAPTDAELTEQIKAVLEDQINPAVAMHGGFINLVEVKDGKAFIEMGGGCQGCAMSSMTLKSGVEAMLFEEVPDLVEVVDTTDHSGGANPFFG